MSIYLPLVSLSLSLNVSNKLSVNTVLPLLPLRPGFPRTLGLRNFLFLPAHDDFLATAGQQLPARVNLSLSLSAVVTDRFWQHPGRSARGQFSGIFWMTNNISSHSQMTMRGFLFCGEGRGTVWQCCHILAHLTDVTKIWAAVPLSSLPPPFPLLSSHSGNAA